MISVTSGLVRYGASRFWTISVTSASEAMSDTLVQRIVSEPLATAIVLVVLAWNS